MISPAFQPLPVFSAHCAAGRARRELHGLKSGAQLIRESEIAADRATCRCAIVLSLLGVLAWLVLRQV